MYIPDIDKWTKWNLSLDSLLMEIDYAFIDGTFYDADELPNRDMSEIPHPFVVETMDALDHLPAHVKNKVYFIHLNHSNPLLDPQSDASLAVVQRGYHVARYMATFVL